MQTGTADTTTSQTENVRNYVNASHKNKASDKMYIYDVHIKEAKVASITA